MFRDISSRTKIPVAAFCVILIPAFILAVLGFVTLRRWEQTARQVMLESYAKTADMAVAKIEEALRRGEGELFSRVRAVLRRPGSRSAIDAYAFGSVRIDFRQCVAFRGKRQVPLTRKELDIMRYFIAHQGEVLSRERLLDEVWGYERFPTTRTVDNHILKLRQ